MITQSERRSLCRKMAKAAIDSLSDNEFEALREFAAKHMSSNDVSDHVEFGMLEILGYPTN